MDTSTTLTSPDHRDQLMRLSHFLNQEGFLTQIFPGGTDVPLDTLVVHVEGMEEDDRWRVELSFLPLLEAEMGEMSILQCFVVLADGADAAHWEEVRKLVTAINPKLPVGAFGLLEAEEIVYFKQNLLLPAGEHEANFRVVHELVLLTGYLLSLFTSALVGVAMGELSAQEAMGDERFAQYYQ